MKEGFIGPQTVREARFGSNCIGLRVTTHFDMVLGLFFRRSAQEKVDVLENSWENGALRLNCPHPSWDENLKVEIIMWMVMMNDERRGVRTNSEYWGKSD